MRFVFAPIAASSGNGDASWRAKWCTRKYAPFAPNLSGSTARSMDCNRASDPERTIEPGVAAQCPNDRKPIFFTASRLQFSNTGDDAFARNAKRRFARHALGRDIGIARRLADQRR